MVDSGVELLVFDGLIRKVCVSGVSLDGLADWRCVGCAGCE